MRNMIQSCFWRALAFCGVFVALLLPTPQGFAQIQGVLATEAVIAESVPSNAVPLPNDDIVVAINVDMSGMPSPNNTLGSFYATLVWDPAVIQYDGFTLGSAPWNESGVTNTNVQNVASGKLEWSAFSSKGSKGKANVLNVKYKVIGVPGSSTVLDLNFSAMTTAAPFFIKLLDKLTVIKGNVTVRVNQPPVLAVISDQVMNEGTTLKVLASATDPDGNNIHFRASNLPAFASFTDNNNGTATISFTPGYNDAGVYSPINVVAFDDGIPALEDTASFTLTVKNVNRPPTIRPLTPPNTVVNLNEGGKLEFSLLATDPDGDKITLRGGNLPVFASMIDSGNGTGRLILAPGREDAGEYPNITVVATDDGTPNLSDSTTLNLKVMDTLPTLTCKTEIVSPQDGATIYNDSVEVCVNIQIAGAVGPVQKVCEVNGIPLTQACVKIPLASGFNTISAISTVTDSLGSVCASSQTIRVFVILEPLKCGLTITTPAEGASVCGDSVEVKAMTTISGGISPYQKVCEVNGVPAQSFNAGFAAKVPCRPGKNMLIATCKITDARNNTAICHDTITVLCPAPPVCRIEMTSPQDSTFVCEDSIKITGLTMIAGEAPPFMRVCDINGVPAKVTGNMFTATVPLNPGWNNLIATCTVTDSCGQTAVCRDTTRVLSIIDKTPPTCTFTFRGSSAVKGFFADEESGIAEIKPLYLFNATFLVDPFKPGDKKVNFSLENLGLAWYMGFDIKITDLCGNSLVYDPVMAVLSMDQMTRQYTFAFRGVERYLILTNHGLSEIHVDLNDQQFDLYSGSTARVRPVNAYRMPEEGSITIDLQPYLHEGENSMRLEIEGRAGTHADFLLIDKAYVIDHTLELEPIPAEFQLSQNYPNPFNPRTTIRFSIPARLAEGTPVRLHIYNAMGELIRTLVDENMFPGQYAVEWDGKNMRGETVASGFYLYQLVTRDHKETKRMTFLK